MPRMTAAQAAVEILKREGVTHVFGLPGAAINPFYSAMRTNGGLTHVLARHVEGASHMAEGYTRTKAGNIGVCVGTSGPAGTDMITGLYSASADSIPILCITGQAPVAKLHKEDFQAVDITATSSSSRRGALTSAWATPRRCFMPREKPPMRVPTPVRPARSRSAATRASRTSPRSPKRLPAKRRYWGAVIHL